MAPRGRIGRLPRTVQSLTNQIVSIAREMEQQRAQNLMDAWQKGGEFEGGPATDERVLAFWKERLKGVATDDPLHDTYKNLVGQYEYTIAKSKTETLYAQGKIGEQAMGRFYLNWAKKVPRNSEFYRELQRDGARFLQASAARGRAGSRSRANAAYDAAQAKLSQGTRVGSLLDWALTGIANVNGLLGADDTKGLKNLSDPAHLAALIDGINKDPSAPLFQVGDQVWTGATLMGALHQLDPGFKAATRDSKTHGATLGGLSGGLSLDYIRRAMSQTHATYLKIAAQASATGHVTDAKSAMKAADGVQETIREVAVWGAAPAYNAIIAQRDHILKDPNATSEEKRQAALDAGQSIAALARNPALDLRTQTTLLNEANANVGDTAQGKVESFGEDYLGLTTQAPGNEQTAADGSATSPGANARISNLVANLNAENEAVTANPESFVYTHGTRDAATGVFTFDPNGKDIGVASGVDVQRSGLPYATIAVPQLSGSPLLVTVMGQAIKASALDANGNKITAGRVGQDGQSDTLNDPSLGTVYTYSIHGETVRMYQVSDGKGGQIFTTVPPWAAGATERDNKDGSITVDLSGLVAQGVGTHNVEAIPGETGKYATDQQGPGTSLRYDPMAAISSIRNHAGYNEATDFSTPLIASLSVSPDAQATASAMVRDPIFRAKLYNQEIAASGGDATKLQDIMLHDSNILTGAIIPGSNVPPMYGQNSNDPAFSAAVQPGSTTLTPDSPFYGLHLGVKSLQELAKTMPAGGTMGAFQTAAQTGRDLQGRGVGVSIKTADQLRLPSLPDWMKNLGAPRDTSSLAGIQQAYGPPPAAPINTSSLAGIQAASMAPAITPNVMPTVTPAVQPSALPKGTAGVAGKTTPVPAAPAPIRRYGGPPRAI